MRSRCISTRFKISDRSKINSIEIMAIALVFEEWRSRINSKIDLGDRAASGTHFKISDRSKINSSEIIAIALVFEEWRSRINSKIDLCDIAHD